MSKIDSIVFNMCGKLAKNVKIKYKYLEKVTIVFIYLNYLLLNYVY